MATIKPRLMVTLPQSAYDSLSRFASVSGCSMSKVVSDILIASQQTFDKVSMVVESARAMEESALAAIKPSFEVGESFASALTSSADALVDDLLDLVGGGHVDGDGGI